MSVVRGSRVTPATPPRFRCLVCRVFVTGGLDGGCPRCGWMPPTVVPLPARAPARLPAWLVAALVAVAAALLAWAA